MNMLIDQIKKDAIFEADAMVFNTLRKELKDLGHKMQRNREVNVNSDYFEGKDVEHIVVDSIPMYYKKIGAFGSGILFHLDMIKGEMPILYEQLSKMFGKTRGPEFMATDVLSKWFNERNIHLYNNKKLQDTINIGVLENLQSFKDFNK